MTAPYTLITAAHNEDAFLDKTIASVTKQTHLPIRWIIVDDSSSDKTLKIAQAWSQKYSFIETISTRRPPGRNFANKVRAINSGKDRLSSLPYQFIGNLDADISLETNYFATLLQEFQRDERLGIAGGMVWTKEGETFRSQQVAPDSVAGAVQMFRRKCFEQIGGYAALKLGGIDAAAEITARAHGWKVQTISGLRAYEHRRTGSATSGPLRARFKEGRRFHSLGYGTLFFGARCAYRLFESPILIGSIAALLGFALSRIRREPVELPPNIVRHLREEQRRKILHRLQTS